MICNIFGPDDDPKKINGFTIVVDVFRAFSTSYYINENKPQKYIITDSIEHAFSIKNLFPSALLIGERNGIKVDGFDYGNSPTEIKNIDFSNNIIIHTTTAGTKGLICQKIENEVIVGSFVNCESIIEYIQNRKLKIINIYCTAPKDSLFGEEDYLFAQFVKNKLTEMPTNYESIILKLRKGSGKGFRMDGFAPYTDFLYCMDYSRFHSILKRKIVNEENHSIELENIGI
jgi:2-phosphosulfolactate phosphatase